MKSRKIVGLILILVLVGLPAWFGRFYLGHYWTASGFSTEKLTEWEEALGASEDRPSTAIPPRRGKVLLLVPSLWTTDRWGTVYATGPMGGKKVDRIDPAWVDWDQSRLDPGIRARSPDEVETLIICQHASEVVGYYLPEEWAPTLRQLDVTDQGRRRFVLLKVWDMKAGEWLGQYVLFGDMPKVRIEQGEDQMGPRPDLAAFVARMPTR